MWSSKNFIFSGEHSREGENILHYLCRNGGAIDLLEYKNAIIDENRYLVREYNFQGQQCIHIVASEDKLDPRKKLMRLMEWGADINAKESINGDTPLHITVRTKNYELAEWLCRQPQVNIEALNYAQQTPYHLAYEYNNAKMMNILEEIAAERKTSWNPLTYSSIFGLNTNKSHMLPDIIISSNGDVDSNV